MTYKHLSLTERNSIEKLRNHAGFSLRKIGSLLNRSASTISRELRRNATGSSYTYKEAERAAKARQRGCRRRVPEGILELAVELMCEGLSPEQASEYLAMKGVAICRQTIYNRVWEDHAEKGKLWQLLRFCGRTGQRCSRYKTGPSGRQRRRRRDPRRVYRNRPKSIGARRHYGHWEMDLLEGKGRARPVLVLLERKSRYVITRFLPRKDAGLVARALKAMLEGFKVRSITTDNGPEFAAADMVEETFGCRLYYTDPYSSWQKGAVENANGLLRQYLPKGTDFLRCTPAALKEATDLITWRIRKCLGWKSPDDLYTLITT